MRNYEGSSFRRVRRKPSGAVVDRRPRPFAPVARRPSPDAVAFN